MTPTDSWLGSIAGQSPICASVAHGMRLRIDKPAVILGSRMPVLFLIALGDFAGWTREERQEKAVDEDDVRLPARCLGH
jgi:hypothetical protein